MVHSIPTGDMRMQKIREILRMTSCSTLKYGKNQYFKVEQNDVCRKFFIEIVLGISESTVCRAKLNLLSSATSPVPRKQTHASRGRICVGFIQAYVEATCDRDPTGTVYRMPTSLTKLDLFNLYDIVHQENSLHKSMFYEILKKRFSNVIFSKKQRYTKCKECNEFRELISAEKNVELKKEIIMLRDLHLREQQMEREAYYVRRAQAEMRPGEFLSVILDGMDQKKTNLPYYTHDNNPVGSGQHKLRTHITGSIVHGRGKYFFLDCNQYPHDTNLVLSCLLKLLVKESREGQLPPTLFVQLDNTCRENKNKFFLGMMAFLVKKRFVREVWISFLIVGHTHEDVDQCFSRISMKMRNRNTLTLNELHSVIQSSQRPVPESTDVGTVWNMSAWLNDYVNQIHNVTYPKLYRYNFYSFCH
ncbi:uncharacterized protein LOC123560063 [Mercenaria mercenaria]|uniref:uncharacterized protein LOC123560063 n=1 Tax=Mercenaria mercenaria TaxID=6596 RepID=UPI00234F57E3|nr:uncharacterized protein LOC123560063 [Mercenaria mercenaria]